jgi:hypothetical protein
VRVREGTRQAHRPGPRWRARRAARTPRPPPRVLRPGKYPYYPCTVTPLGLRSPLVRGHVANITLAPNRSPGQLLPSPTFDRARKRGPKPHLLLVPKPIGIFSPFFSPCSLPIHRSAALSQPPAPPLCSVAACSGAPHPVALFRSPARTPPPISPTVSRAMPRVPSLLTTRAAPSTGTNDDTEQELAPEPSRTTTVSKTGDRVPGVPCRREPEGAKQGINAVAVNITTADFTATSTSSPLGELAARPSSPPMGARPSAAPSAFASCSSWPGLRAAQGASRRRCSSLQTRAGRRRSASVAPRQRVPRLSLKVLPVTAAFVSCTCS